MSRSGYTDDIDDDPLALGRWRQAVKRSLEGKRGQALLRELIEALDAMPEKELYPGSFATAEGEFCSLGVLGVKRGIRMDDLGDEDECDPDLVASRFGIAPAMAAEIMYMNDEYAVQTHHWIDIEICGPMRDCRLERNGCWGYESHQRTVQIYDEKHPQKRWLKMRAWAVENLKAAQ